MADLGAQPRAVFFRESPVASGGAILSRGAAYCGLPPGGGTGRPPLRGGSVRRKGAESVAMLRIAGLCGAAGHSNRGDEQPQGGGRRAELSPSRFCSRLANRDTRSGASAGKTELVEVTPVSGGVARHANRTCRWQTVSTGGGPLLMRLVAPPGTGSRRRPGTE